MTDSRQNVFENGHWSSDTEKVENQAKSSQENSDMKAISQRFKVWRQQFQAIASQMRQATDVDTLFKVTVAQIREKIASDRTLIYQFNSSESGIVLAESRTTAWTPALGENLPSIIFGLHASQDHLEPIAIDDINQIQLTPYQKQLLEKFQIKASLSLPIIVDGKVWGLLAVNNCSSQREWLEAEISQLSQITTELTHRLQHFEFQRKLQQQTQEQKSIAKVIDKIQRLSNLDDLFHTTTQEVRQLLQCDRVSVYRFNSNWTGEYIAESVASGWKRLVGPDIKTVWEDTHLQETQGGRYRYHENLIVNNIYKAGHSLCHVEMLEQFEVKAYATVPVFSGQKLWGLLAAYQNSGTRDWQNWEVNLLTQIAVHFGVGISQTEYFQQVQTQSQQLARTTERQRNLITLTRKIGEALTEKVTGTLQFEGILQATVAEVRRLLQVDRTAVYRFNPDWSGEFIAESIAKGWIPFKEKDFDRELLQENGHCSTIRNLSEYYKVKDNYLQENQGGRYQQKTSFVVDDVYKAGFPPCYMELLEQFEAKAYLTIPIFKEDKLWGLLASYQHTESRHWEEFEVNAMTQVAVLLGAAMQQAETFQSLQRQSQQVAKTAERDRTVAKIIDRIRQSLDIDTIFTITTKEVRSLLNSDRVAVYRFNSDWSGLFVSESVGNGWSSLVDKQDKIENLQESVSVCDAMQNLIQSSKSETKGKAHTDTYLKATQGGEFRHRKAYIVADIYKAEFSRCYIEVLEQYEARAYAIVPIFQGQKLWGMLASFQNNGPRTWEDSEVSLLTRIGDQLGLALQQAEYLQQLQAQSQEKEQSVQRVQIVSKIVERIRDTSDLDTLFRSTANEVRRLLNAERVGVFCFLRESGYDEGVFVAEDVVSGYSSVLKEKVKDHCFSKDYASAYREGRIQAVTDIYNANFTKCHVEILTQLQVRANLIVPLIKGSELWGLLCIHQCSAPRQWQEQEIELVKQIAAQFGVALQQAEYLQQLQTQSAKLEAAATREKAAKELLQQRCMQLLAAVRPALNGDLTVRAPITEDELGTIADAYNNTLQALRQTVIQVQVAVQQVAQTSSDSDASLTGLTQLAKQQSEEISAALGEMQQMVDSTQAVVTNAELVQVAVQKANRTVESGDTAMNLTVQAIQGIRETVAQTSKKIKRLSESSQKISKVVNLISNFATQTNVLALNAAIEATRAGEYGKGFAVVADEVRSLSRQSAAATIEIEKLVQEIQGETGEVAVAMETGIQQVVEGTNLVGETKQNLNAIVLATAEISQLIQQITETTQTQMTQSVTVTKAMKDVAEISHKTFAESQEIATVFQQLSGMAKELLANASQFKVN
ncbi:MAG: GAF domain-containing protein [Desmonostoc vinosum HA7617-LM4]|jgi:methyl-accepting chemotaxis protein PixJ|nr:GAF domain-containing protein [Desmonostoc vinosum HA7617-LM4]